MRILRNQLGRRNLTDFQRNKIALRYEDIIAKRMKERQLEAATKGGSSYSPVFGRKDMTKWSEPSLEPTTKRAELAKIAGTYQGSIQMIAVHLKSHLFTVLNLLIDI